MAVVPHFDLPFRFTNGHAAVVEQNSEADIRNCVEAIVRTPLGTRPFVPEFGISDPTFELEPIDIVTLEAQISKNEPRAAIQLDQSIDSADALITHLRVGL